MDYTGDIIEESLADKSILDGVTILDTRIEPVTGEHNTPWLKQWTLHKVAIPEGRIEHFVQEAQSALETTHSAWYTDFKGPEVHYIIFPERIFKIGRRDSNGYAEAKRYGMSLGIPEDQVNFSPGED